MRSSAAWPKKASAHTPRIPFSSNMAAKEEGERRISSSSSSFLIPHASPSFSRTLELRSHQTSHHVESNTDGEIDFPKNSRSPAAGGCASVLQGIGRVHVAFIFVSCVPSAFSFLFDSSCLLLVFSLTIPPIPLNSDSGTYQDVGGMYEPIRETGFGFGYFGSDGNNQSETAVAYSSPSSSQVLPSQYEQYYVPGLTNLSQSWGPIYYTEGNNNAPSRRDGK